jgi:4'-phosphopantetheinyl transferase
VTETETGTGTGTGTGTVRVWIGPVDVPADEEARCRETLGPGERASAATLVHEPDRRRFTVAHGALRLLAARELGVPPDALTWTTGRHGKPELTPPWSGWHTSLSHSGGLIAVAVSTGRPVGVDVQQVTANLDVTGMSGRFFPPGEAEYVAAGADAGARADRFARLWVRKEAVVKAAGGRLWPNLRTAVHRRGLVDCADPAGRYRVTAIAAPAGYRAAVALAGAARYSLEVTDWPAAARPHAAAASGPVSL